MKKSIDKSLLEPIKKNSKKFYYCYSITETPRECKTDKEVHERNDRKS